MAKPIKILEGQKGRIKYKPTYMGESVLERVTIDHEASDHKGLIIPGDAIHNPDKVHGEIAFKAKAKATGDLKVVFVRDGKKDGVEGEDISTKVIPLVVDPAELTIADMHPIKVGTDGLVGITIVLMNGEEIIPLDDKDVEFIVPESFQLISRAQKDISLVSDYNHLGPDVNMTLVPIKINYFSGTVEKSLEWYWPPVDKVVSNIPEAMVGDTGTNPIKILGPDGTDITSVVKSIVIESNEYFSYSDGKWTILKEPPTSALTVRVRYTHSRDGFDWAMSLSFEIKIKAKPKSIKPKLTSGSSTSPLSSGTITMDLVYDTGEIVTDAVIVSSTKLAHNDVYSYFGTEFRATDAEKGKYSFTYTSGYNSGIGQAKFVVKTKYGEYTFDSPTTNNQAQPLEISSTPSSMPKNNSGTVFTVTAKQRQSVSGSPVAVSGTMYSSGAFNCTIEEEPSGSGPWTIKLSSKTSTNSCSVGLRVNGATGTLTIAKV